MKLTDKKKVREMLEQDVAQARKLERVHRKGRPWLRDLRQAMGVSISELAERLECSRSLVYRIEQREMKGWETVGALEEVAEAMDCRLLYAIVPRDGKTVEETAQWLKANPRRQTEKQQARRAKAMEEKERKWTADHWEWVHQKKDESTRAERMQAFVETLSEEWAVEKDKREREVAMGTRLPEPGWTARWAWQRVKEHNAASGNSDRVTKGQRDRVTSGSSARPVYRNLRVKDGAPPVVAQLSS